MAVRIRSTVPQGNVNRSTSRSSAKKESGGSEKAGASARVDLSGREAAVSIAKTASSSVNEVDETKVAELRAKIASGEYHADLKIVAERIIAEAVAFGKE